MRAMRHSHPVWIEGKPHSFSHVHKVEDLGHRHTVGQYTGAAHWTFREEVARTTPKREL